MKVTEIGVLAITDAPSTGTVATTAGPGTHVPDPLQSVPPPSLQVVPNGANVVPQVLLVQARDRHSPSMPGHCAAELHSTHVPVPLQKTPPSWLQGELTGSGGLLGVPAVQSSDVHWYPSTGTSELSIVLTVFPEPSH